MIRIIVADDHALVRAGIIGLLQSREDIDVVSETGSAREAVEMCAEKEPDVILLDLNMPDMDGLEATKRILEKCPELKVLILTMHENEEYAMRVLKAGASGFLVKGISPEELPVAIRKVAAGEIYVTESIMKKIILRQTRGGGCEEVLSILSDREIQVFTYIARGMSLNEIAEDLNVSASTIGTYKSRVMEKLRLGSNADIMRVALRLGFIDKFD